MPTPYYELTKVHPDPDPWRGEPEAKETSVLFVGESEEEARRNAHDYYIREYGRGCRRYAELWLNEATAHVELRYDGEHGGLWGYQSLR